MPIDSYNADRQYVPGRKGRFERWLDVSFLTIHRSKGSEADYVILPEMLSVARDGASRTHVPTILYWLWPCRPETTTPWAKNAACSTSL